jgi:hypothetical protein
LYQRRIEGPTAGCQYGAVVDALFFFIWVGQDGLNLFITQCILCCSYEKTVTQVVICQLSWEIGPVLMTAMMAKALPSC